MSDKVRDPLRDVLEQMEAVERLRGVVRRLEWAGTRDGDARCCPACRGIDPSDRLSGGFTPESHGHRRDCYLAAALPPMEGRDG